MRRRSRDPQWRCIRRVAANATAAALGCEGELVVSLISDQITEGDCAGNYQIARTVEMKIVLEGLPNTRTT